MDHSKHTPLRPEELDQSLEGANVYGPNDDHIGDVAHFHGSGSTASVVIDVGGFLGLGTKPVSVPVSSLNFMRDEDGNVHATTSMTEEQLKDLPEHTD